MFEGMTTDEKIAYCEHAIEKLTKSLNKRRAQGYVGFYATSAEFRAERAIAWYERAIKKFEAEKDNNNE
ncbi:MAG: hypothetical protein ACYTFW_00655 [Planctomycetota bacterium]|jgi:hypothetical protein